MSGGASGREEADAHSYLVSEAHSSMIRRSSKGVPWSGPLVEKNDLMGGRQAEGVMGDGS